MMWPLQPLWCVYEDANHPGSTSHRWMSGWVHLPTGAHKHKVRKAVETDRRADSYSVQHQQEVEPGGTAQNWRIKAVEPIFFRIERKNCDKALKNILCPSTQLRACSCRSDLNCFCMPGGQLVFAESLSGCSEYEGKPVKGQLKYYLLSPSMSAGASGQLEHTV